MGERDRPPGLDALPPSSVEDLQQRLLAWYRVHRRILPWREDPTPYRVWVSEMMLQQTRTETVLPYFQRWMEGFPDVETLARADLSDVLRVWEGLGYYARARYLHEAAQRLVQENGGRIPDDLASLQDLPGIGRYTAGAILSIAFGQDVPVVDGNVARVFARLFAIGDVITESATQHRLWALAEQLLPAGDAAGFNQAVMELGARVCTPRHPDCPHCPLQTLCQGYSLEIQTELPVRPTRRIPTVDVAIGVLRRGDRIYVQRRPAEGLLGGLWEFPGGKRLQGEALRECLARELREEVGFQGAIGPKLLSLRHAYSMFKVNLHAYECQWEQGEPRPEAAEWQWANGKMLERLPFPAANRRLIEMLLAGDPSQGHLA